MTNFIQLNTPCARQSHQDRLSAMIDCFTSYRRFGDDVFWLQKPPNFSTSLNAQAPPLRLLLPSNPMMAFAPESKSGWGSSRNTTASSCRYVSIWKISTCEQQGRSAGSLGGTRRIGRGRTL